jgi:hypothetical protein
MSKNERRTDFGIAHNSDLTNALFYEKTVYWME